MVSDSVVNASAQNASKDLGKKKRANRSAKLKQCKLDARREQWLSQVKNKGCEEELNGVAVVVGSGGQLNRTGKKSKAKAAVFKDLELESQETHHDSDSESSSHANSPTSCLSGANDSGTSYSGSSSSSSSSSSSISSGGSCSGNLTEEEEEEEVDVGGGCADDDGCLDDWEAMADALEATTPSDKQGHDSSADLPPSNETGFGSELVSRTEGAACVGVDSQSERLKCPGVGMLGNGVANRKAWRPDDASRPQCLPNLSKQHSFPANSERHCCPLVNPWVRTNIPTSCPICCEDLDLTDSSFLPCSCGFRLCLFCHKRILEEDGRCPGCRKPYTVDLVKEAASVSEGSLTIRLARSCSMYSRV